MKIKILIATVVTTLVSASCSDFLDQVPDDRLTLEQTFANENTVEQYLANVYSVLPDELSQRHLANNAGPWTGGSDEAEYVWSFVSSNDMNIGTWNPTTGFVNDKWTNYYRGIRNASYFMEHIYECQDCVAQLEIQYHAEARALRAIYYYHLIRLYGPVVLLEDTPIPPDAPVEKVHLPRSTFDACVEYIVSELDEAMLDLPNVPRNDDAYGRITRAYAMAIRSQVLLLAASPLFNGNTDYGDLMNADGTHLISQTYNEDKWSIAEESYKQFITEFVPGTFDLYRKSNSEGRFDPYLSTRDVMLDEWNQEIIMARPAADVGSRQYEMTPFHAGSSGEARGSGGLGVTQAMVDAYFMANGRSIDDPQSGYEASGFSSFRTPYDFMERETFNQWVGREPRFYTNITFDNTLWLNRNTGDIITRTWYEGNSGRKAGGNDYSPTGYIVRKNMGLGAWTSGNRANSMLRLAEIYLDYAEALNESSPGNPEILKYINLIRNRAGIPEYGSGELEAPAGKIAMREAIRKERRVELAFESVRYFDARRWKVAEEAFGGPMIGLDINAPDIKDFYKKVPFENRVFDKRHYLWPIPQDDINTNKKLVQNIGW
ncbi:MAG: RagB/SusD family nutrient uptake outer membrane protein [Cytophagales bacterium]|nr:RagB/SusD family nutrient uptake outer membrane protein [Cytophagales bacterium]